MYGLSLDFAILRKEANGLLLPENGAIFKTHSIEGHINLGSL